MLTLHERNGLDNHAPGDALPLIDAHHHLWNLSEGRYPWLQEEYHEDFFLGDYHAIRRDFGPGDFLRVTSNQRVIGTVHVEAERSRNEQIAETQWLHRVHERFGFPNAVVAHAWFDRDDTAHVLARHASFPLVRGIRSKPVTSAGPGESVSGQRGTMQDPAWLDGFALLERFDLSWDLRVPPWHLPEAAEVAAAFPRIRIALNHAGFAWDRSDAGLRRWRGWMEKLAAQPNVHVKLSEFGLKDEPWRYESNRVIVEDVVAMFGVGRCMFASNYPVASLRASYDTLADGLARMLAPLGREAQERVFYRNALDFYRIRM
ncbi:putative TIM-barrel fold metal-dependent hydrolase [Paraburkholderia sp. BL8N3]|nr:amidohydrolase family protein [Paraburkholderia sp. BL8N3]TCK36581.1 putative TIM-barrel fold metal-dependent hydrolase [Paraburkholderia sp. BL8N3]